jgi:Tfp pilus assembly protein PilE
MKSIATMRLNNVPKWRTAGLTLVELLISLLIASILLIGTSAIFVRHMKDVQRLEAYTRLQENWKRVQFLIDQDIQESTGSILTTSTCAPIGSSGIMTLLIPAAGGSAISSSGSVTYYKNGSELRRCGVSINLDGSLDTSVTDTDSLVASGITSFIPDTSNSRLPNYSLSISDATGLSYSASSMNPSFFGRSRIVDTDP